MIDDATMCECGHVRAHHPPDLPGDDMPGMCDVDRCDCVEFEAAGPE